MYINTGKEALAGRMIYLYHSQVQRRQAGLCSALGQKEVNPLHSPSNAALGIQASLSGFGKRNTEKRRRKKPGEVWSLTLSGNIYGT